MMTKYTLSLGIILILAVSGPAWAAPIPVGCDAELGQTTDDLRHPVPTLGPQSQVTILLRYADIPDTPKPATYFQFMMLSNNFPGLNNFLKEISYNNANVDGSQVVGWITLPRDWDYYNWPFDDFQYPRLDINRVLADCIPMVDSIVHFPSFDNIVLMFNAEHGCGDAPSCGEWAGTVGARLTVDGITKDYGIQFFGPFWFSHQAAIAHEMMHSFGVHHTGPLVDGGEPSHWDVTTGSGTCSPPDPDYGCLAVYTSAWHMLKLGWMPSARSFNPGISGAGIVPIERLALPPLYGGTFGMAELMVNGSSTLSYTVEYRTPVGWDGAGPIPGQAVVLHRVDTTLEDLVTEVVDPDGDGDPNDASAMWLPGETYLNSGAGVVVHVESWTSTRAVVSVSNKARSTVNVRVAADGYEDGSSLYPWNTVKEGYASVYPGGAVYMVPGTYHETMTISKPCRLMVGAGTGSVIIGE